MTCVTLASFGSSALTSLRSPLASAKASAAMVKTERDWRCIVPLYSGFMQSLPKSDCTASNSRSHDAVIRVDDSAGSVIEIHEHRGDFKEW
jgi:hypothetical protein